MFLQILKFYDEEKRDFPWRTSPINPYFVYLSEIMLQQTTTTTVKDYFLRFIQKFPTLEALAKADSEDVFLLWQGLGYYSRARNLHKAAQLMSAQGGMPKSYNELIALPGIGDYTAKAVLSIAFNEPVLPIDGNIKRVFARYFGLDVPYEQLHKTIHDLMHGPRISVRDVRRCSSNASSFDFHGRPGDICQGLMDFANIICLPKTPKCKECPLRQSCQAYLSNRTATLPRPKKKILKKIMVMDGLVCIKEGCIGLNLHKSGTLLGGLWNIPMVEGGGGIPTIRHIFTHIDLRLTLRFVDDVTCDEFAPLENLSAYPLSRLTMKVIENIPNVSADKSTG
jgi:A/G-specific adenine glycosylase